VLYLAIAVVALLVGALVTLAASRKQPGSTDEALEVLNEANKREHEADAKEQAGADPTDYLRDGFGRLR
jgi:hypothetical protein